MMKMMFGRRAPTADPLTVPAAGRLASSAKAGTRANQIRQARQVRPARKSSFSF
jgi:hypothetical protein